MDFAIDTTAAATLCALLVALFKAAAPAAPTPLLIAVALVSGIAAAFLTALASDVVFTQPTIAQTVISGILAAGAAAGVTRTDAAAERVRAAERNPQEEPRHVTG
jgi:high-affinity Fe2+/Pb2+ permease